MGEFETKLREALGADLQVNVSLKPFVSFGTGGVAEFFYIAKGVDDLVRAITTAYDLKIPYFVLGGGYNVLPSDKGVPGLVIKNECANIAFSDTSQVIVDSGMPLGRLINLAASREFGGLEFLFGVPGTVGGAVYGNAGAFSYEIGDFVKSVIVLMQKEGKMAIVKKTPEWMEFEYRSSRLKKEFSENKFKPVILTVKLQLARRRRDEILSIMQSNLKKKQAGQPLKEKCAGSFFKNPGFSPEMSAGYLLDKSGAKRMKVGDAAVSSKHANFLINKKNATSEEIKNLADNLKQKVQSDFSINLEEEIEYIGKW